jgi:hypothetical protein
VKTDLRQAQFSCYARAFSCSDALTTPTDRWIEAKTARLAERERAERCRSQALAELAAHSGDLHRVRLSDEARHVLLDLYARSLVDGDRADRTVMLTGTAVLLHVRTTPGRDSVITSPTGRMSLVGRTLAIEPVEEHGLAAGGDR